MKQNGNLELANFTKSLEKECTRIKQEIKEDEIKHKGEDEYSVTSSDEGTKFPLFTHKNPCMKTVAKPPLVQVKLEERDLYKVKIKKLEEDRRKPKEQQFIQLEPINLEKQDYISEEINLFRILSK